MLSHVLTFWNKFFGTVSFTWIQIRLLPNKFMNPDQAKSFGFSQTRIRNTAFEISMNENRTTDSYKLSWAQMIMSKYGHMAICPRVKISLGPSGDGGSCLSPHNYVHFSHVYSYSLTARQSCKKTTQRRGHTEPGEEETKKKMIIFVKCTMNKVSTLSRGRGPILPYFLY